MRCKAHSFALLLLWSSVVAQTKTWGDVLGKKRIVYAPDYIDRYAYFEEGDELVTETVKVEFPSKKQSLKELGYRSLSYREVDKKKFSLPQVNLSMLYKQITAQAMPDNLPIQSDTMVDEWIRPWNFYAWLSGGEDPKRAACVILPQAYVCLLAKDPDRSLLSQVYVRNPYWKFEAIVEFQKQFPEFPIYSDVEIVDLSPTKKKLKLKTLGKTFVLDVGPRDMLRIAPALARLGKGESPRWIAFGYDHYKQTLDRKQICKAEINLEALEMKEHFLALQKRRIQPKLIRFNAIKRRYYLWESCTNASFDPETDLLKLN